MAIVVSLVAIMAALVFSFAVPELLTLFNDAETASTGVPASIQNGIGSFREVIGVVVIFVFAALFWATIKTIRE